jgi:glycosyltransferase involved in cell wall biosynthesis
MCVRFWNCAAMTSEEGHMASTTSSVDLVLPALNEQVTIAATIEGLARELPTARFILVDNGSEDQTKTIARTTFDLLGCNYVLVDVPLRGKGNAVRAAFAISDADVVVMIDADDTYPADRVHELIGPIVRGTADMVVADRHSDGSYGRENTRSMHGFGNRLVQQTVNRLYSSDLRDILSGYRAFSWQFVRTYPVMVNGFELETDLTLHVLDKRLRVTEVAVEYRDRPPGSESKLTTYRDGARVLWTLFNLFRRFKPMAFFASISASCWQWV